MFSYANLSRIYHYCLKNQHYKKINSQIIYTQLRYLVHPMDTQHTNHAHTMNTPCTHHAHNSRTSVAHQSHTKLLKSIIFMYQSTLKFPSMLVTWGTGVWLVCTRCAARMWKMHRTFFNYLKTTLQGVNIPCFFHQVRHQVRLGL